MTRTEKQPAPSLLRRLTAMLYDTLLVVALVGVVNAFALGLIAWASDGAEQLLNAHVVQALTVFTVVGFFSLFWVKNGQTLGMQAWRIRLVDFDGGTPTWGKAILRCAGALLSAACLGLGYLWCLFDHNKRYWHDYLSGTEMVLLPKSGTTNGNDHSHD